VAAATSATVAIWPANAAAQQPAAAQQNSRLQHTGGLAAASAAEPGLAATHAVAAADTAAGAGAHHRTHATRTHVIGEGHMGGRLLIFMPEFMAHQERHRALEARRRAAAVRRARRLAVRRRAAARAAARQAAAAARRAAHRRAVQATAPAQPSGSPQQIAMAMLGSYGWSASEFGCLNDLWTRESGWNPTAANASGAYGIPQALPGSKMASAGADWQTNPATQIRWGLGYIKGLYGSPCGAWAHSQATGWY
jgi:Transglycosylase SLT domain